MTRSTVTRASMTAVLVLAAVTLGGDCDGDIAQDPTFRDWCGATLCAWTLVKGKIAPVPTWNQNDLGVSFEQTPTIISQATTESQATCLLFTSVANIDPSAEMTLGVDFNSDGSFEYHGPIASASWQQVQSEIPAPAAYQGITFVITKGGSGTAVLAEMRIQSTTGCSPGAVEIEAGTLDLGEKCSTAADCHGGLTCTGASSDAVCSQCSSSQPCPNGEKCVARSVFLPAQCAPGEGLGAMGAACLTGSDCASGACDGAVPVALGDEAGTCDLDAALGIDGGDNCQWYGARGGSCQ
jgi:hypothetical protein